MKAVLFRSFGEPAEVLELADVPCPEPAAGMVRVRMIASPINPSDLLVIRGKYRQLPTLPSTPGFEGVGIVESAGPGLMGRFLVGRRVVVPNRKTGNWQECVIAPARQVIPVSSGLSDEQAATLFVNPTTAYAMTRRVLQVPRGEWLLQTAAASQVGRMVVRLGQRFGFRTLNVVRRQEQVDELKSLGADAVVVSIGADLRQHVESITRGEGVRYAIDPVGGELAHQVVTCLAPFGRLLLFGTLSEEPVLLPPRDLMSGCCSIEGFWLGGWIQRLGLVAKLRLFRSIGQLIKESVLASEIGASFGIDQVREAVTAAQSPNRRGKVLLRMR